MYVTAATYVLMFLCAVAYPLVYLMGLSPDLQQMVVVVSFSVAILSTFYFLFFPKLALLLSGADFDANFMIVRSTSNDKSMYFRRGMSFRSGKSSSRRIHGGILKNTNPASSMKNLDGNALSIRQIGGILRRPPPSGSMDSSTHIYRTGTMQARHSRPSLEWSVHGRKITPGSGAPYAKDGLQGSYCSTESLSPLRRAERKADDSEWSRHGSKRILTTTFATNADSPKNVTDITRYNTKKSFGMDASGHGIRPFGASESFRLDASKHDMDRSKHGSRKFASSLPDTSRHDLEASLHSDIKFLKRRASSKLVSAVSPRLATRHDTSPAIDLSRLSKTELEERVQELVILIERSKHKASVCQHQLQQYVEQADCAVCSVNDSDLAHEDSTAPKLLDNSRKYSARTQKEVH